MLKPTDDRHEFKPLLVEIEDRPLNPLGRTVFWIVIAAILFTCLWMFFGKVDVVVTAQGKVVPSGEVKTVQPLNSGVVRNILIHPGDSVIEGQILMEIDPSHVDPELISMQTDYKQVELEIERLNSLLEGREFTGSLQHYNAESLRLQQEVYSSEKERLKKQIQVKRESLAQLDERLAAEKMKVEQAEYLFTVLTEKLERLHKVKAIISRDEYDRTENEAKQYETEFKVSECRIAELIGLKQQTNEEIAYIKEEYRNRLLAELSAAKQRHLYLHARIDKAEFVSTRQQITSPVDGHVSQLLFHTVGGVVTPAEKLAVIVPSNSPLLIKSTLLSKDVGFVAENMAVTIKIDTFSFQKYGTITGTVLHVSNDSIEDEHLGLIYEVYIRPEKSTLLVDGIEMPISAGMSVVSEVNIGERRIIEFFIYPLIKYLDEGISVR